MCIGKHIALIFFKLYCSYFIDVEQVNLEDNQKVCLFALGEKAVLQDKRFAFHEPCVMSAI